MSRITARRGDSTLCIVKEGRRIRFFLNGVEDEGMKSLFESLPAEPMGGTYYPHAGSMLACYHALTSGPMSELYDSVETEGDIGRIPHAAEDADRVY